MLALAASMSAALVASVSAAETLKPEEVLPRTLDGYVAQDKTFWDYLKANHPLFKHYMKDGPASSASSPCPTATKNG